MKKVLVLILTAIVLAGCNGVLDKPSNLKDFDKVKEKINSSKEYKPKKKQYIIDELSERVVFSGLAKAFQTEMPTFRYFIDEISSEYDSIQASVLNAIETNKQLDALAVLKSAKPLPIDEYKGYLSMNVDFDNKFDRDILYVMLGYKFTDKYGDVQFREVVRVNDDYVENEFKGNVDLFLTEEYNDVSKFLYRKIPSDITEAEQQEYLMTGLEIAVLKVLFDDKSEIERTETDWEYLEN